MKQERFYLSKEERRQIAMSTRECWICRMLLSSIRNNAKHGLYLRKSTIAEEDIQEHLRQIVCRPIEFNQPLKPTA